MDAMPLRWKAGITPSRHTFTSRASAASSASEPGSCSKPNDGLCSVLCVSPLLPSGCLAVSTFRDASSGVLP
eukprot:CAMPEP_0202419344 /NCGR_PEP_ID=MMETSP1128-20130828/49156_1 /ASSEMBLY_ACC=CAM_ASM_000463 /TAXON_ID=3047 /ORGANISM="Dunaliella tertiolecta, Strain CCMP1320" /LENGTH=71 /DNA_ID=CAMNT_0049027279 /DNA_START=245 /DNA_END=457 /DNA_ORIENTATION=+